MTPVGVVVTTRGRERVNIEGGTSYLLNPRNPSSRAVVAWESKHRILHLKHRLN